MREYLSKLPEDIQELIYLASDVASRNSIPAYLVGGFVRDLILGIKNLDLDIVVEGNGIKFAEDFAGILKAKLIRHRRFGTATIILRHNLKIAPSTSLGVSGERSRTIDIATARKEVYPRPAYLPVVTSGTLRDDLARRDFTVNAMAISIMESDFGRLIDFFCGKDDLRHKKMRILHNLSFIDDPTRILRAIRFEKRYNFRIETETLAYLKEAVRLKMLEKVEPQRLRDELILILKEGRPLKQIRRIQELVSFGFIHPHLTLSKSSYRLLRLVESQINWFKRTYPERRQLDTWLIYFIGLIDSLKINDVKVICKKFVFRRGEGKRILTYKKIGRPFILNLSQDKIKPSKIFNLLEPLSYEVIILIKAKSSPLISGIPQNAGKNRNIKRHIEDFFEIYNGMRLLSCGDDLKRLNVAPGPYYQKIFTKVLNAKLEGVVKTKKEEMELIKELIKAP